MTAHPVPAEYSHPGGRGLRAHGVTRPVARGRRRGRPPRLSVTAPGDRGAVDDPAPGPRKEAAMTADFPIVVLVCSAGGLDALRTVLSPLPANFPAAVLVLQHLSPDRVSGLPDLLGASAALPVVPAVDGDRLVA